MPTENKKTLKEVYQNIGSELTLTGEDPNRNRPGTSENICFGPGQVRKT